VCGMEICEEEEEDIAEFKGRWDGLSSGLGEMHFGGIRSRVGVAPVSVVFAFAVVRSFSTFPLFPPFFRFPALLPSCELGLLTPVCSFWSSLPAPLFLSSPVSSVSLPPSCRLSGDGVDRQMSCDFWDFMFG
jgi:hypothetical protein